MTAIYYADRVARSPNGRYQLEARSPDNGTILQRDGKRSTGFGAQYRQHQSNFRYRLLELPHGRVVWERWQPRGEDSPGELIVSSDGWSVIRTHGFRQEVIAVRPDGADSLRVRVEPPWKNPNRDEGTGDVPTFEWVAERMVDSSAGYYWASHSWRYFVRINRDPHFVWRTSWGDRFVLDLERATPVQPSPELYRHLDEAERRGVEKRLKQLASQMVAVKAWLSRGETEQEGPPVYDELGEWIESATAAIHLAGVHGIAACIPSLLAWEPIDFPSCSTGSLAFGMDRSVCQKCYRPIVRHSLRRLGQEPGPYPAYSFVKDWDGPAFRAPATVPNRAEKLAAVRCPMTAQEVLQTLGPPDHVGRAFGDDLPLEQWEYDARQDGGWFTKYIQWEYAKNASSMVAILDGPEGRAVSDDRANEILDF